MFRAKIRFRFNPNCPNANIFAIRVWIGFLVYSDRIGIFHFALSFFISSRRKPILTPFFSTSSPAPCYPYDFSRRLERWLEISVLLLDAPFTCRISPESDWWSKQTENNDSKNVRTSKCELQNGLFSGPVNLDPFLFLCLTKHSPVPKKMQNDAPEKCPTTRRKPKFNHHKFSESLELSIRLETHQSVAQQHRPSAPPATLPILSLLPATQPLPPPLGGRGQGPLRHMPVINPREIRTPENLSGGWVEHRNSSLSHRICFPIRVVIISVRPK